MKRLLLASVLLCPLPAYAGTLTITAAGFGNLPASAPANWPAGVVWPGAVAPNGTKVYTISDADMLAIIQWSEYAAINNGIVTPFAGAAGVATPQTIGQVLVNFIQHWINGVKVAVQQYMTPAPTPPAAPVIN